MGKRSDFKKRPQDKYYTPIKAVEPLIPHLNKDWKTFIETCAGDGRLCDHIEKLAGIDCVWAMDIDPDTKTIDKLDALEQSFNGEDDDCIITNPPWTRQILHPMIEHFRTQKPTWLLFDADWMHTKQAIPYLKYCKKIVSVGRVSWMENGKSGMDNCAWYLFVKHECETVFVGR